MDLSEQFSRIPNTLAVRLPENLAGDWREVHDAAYLSFRALHLEMHRLSFSRS